VILIANIVNSPHSKEVP